MSTAIDRLIQEAEEYVKSGNLEAANTELDVSLSACPGKPSLKANAAREEQAMLMV